VFHFIGSDICSATTQIASDCDSTENFQYLLHFDSDIRTSTVPGEGTVAFPYQQRLCEHATPLCCMCIAYLVLTTLWNLLPVNRLKNLPMECIHMHVTSLTDYKTLLVTWVVWNLANTVGVSFQLHTAKILLCVTWHKQAYKFKPKTALLDVLRYAKAEKS
jgi:hypothetical protein